MDVTLRLKLIQDKVDLGYLKGIINFHRLILKD